MKLVLLLAAAAAAAQVPSPRTLRLDYVHTGMAGEEHFAVDGVVLEGAWPGPLDRWVDESNLGKYYFQVLDRGTNRVIYSRGFASIYGEWETTAEAQSMNRKAIDYGVLDRDVQTSKQIYESLLQRAKETGVSSELRTSNIRVVDAAERPRTPASPRVR